MSAVRAWDLSSGKPHGLHPGLHARTLTVVACRDPIATGTAKQQPSGVIVADVWGCDRKVVIVERHWFRRSPWWQDKLNNPDGRDPAYDDFYNPAVNSPVKGAGYSGSVELWNIERDDSGEIQEIGQIPSDVFVNGGDLVDGTELEAGVSGVRFKFRVALDQVTGGVENLAQVPAWDLVMRLEVKPAQRIGCNEVLDEVVNGLRFTPPQTLVALNFLTEE